MTPRTAALVMGASVLAAVVWFGLSLATGLIFHFMPAAPMLVAVWVLRADARGGPVPVRHVAAAIGFGALVTLAATPAITIAGGSLDEPWQVVLVTGVGIALAA